MKPSRAPRPYWGDNLRIVAALLAVWALVGFGAGILGIEWLNQFRLGQIELGFWIAQQGSILVFVLLVAGYAWWMDRVDRQHRMRGDE